MDTTINYCWISVFLTVLLFVLLGIYGLWPFTVWSQLGVNGPTPLPFLGNAWIIATKGFFNGTLEWSRKYGKNYGVYLMREPILMTTDVEILKEVFIKDFNNFSYRAPDIPLLPYPVNLGLSLVGGQQWKRQRSIMAPSFSASKLKKMDHFVTRCCDNLLCAVREASRTGTPLQVRELFGSYTLDVVAGTGLGLETNSLAEVDNVFLNNAKAVLGRSNLITVSAALAAAFPFLMPALRWLGCSVIPARETRFVIDTIRNLLRWRRSQPTQKIPDLMQVLLDAEVKNTDLSNSVNLKHMTTDEIVAQGITFFVAGYDTTSICLQFLTYLLAMNPDKQEKLCQAIDAAFEEGKEVVCYEKVTSIRYLDSCIREALRLYPPLPIIARKACQERTIQGLKIPAGCSVGTSVYALMRDEELFPEPHKFKPERFEDDANPIPSLVKDMVFGAGPRQCIGMRLALYEAKMAAVTVLRKFRFVKIKETPEVITLDASTMCSPDKPILIGCQPRHVLDYSPVSPVPHELSGSKYVPSVITTS